MKIGIEAQRIFRREKHGMDIVILDVLRRLQRKDDGNEYIVFVAPGEDRCLESTDKLQIVELYCPTYPVWEQWALPRAARKWNVELLHCTSNTAPLHCPVPLIVTLHDIIFLQASKPKGMSRYQKMGWYYRRWNIPRIIHHCQRIITVSYIEQANILARFPELHRQLTMVHNGYSDCYHPLENIYETTKKYLPETQYLLFLGNTDPRKNTDGVLLAFNEYLNQSARRLKLVITGLAQEYVENRLAQLGIEICTPQIVCTGYIPASDLPAIYNGAYAFLFPSLLEGFGIPVLEAMACGTPVITSNCSSLPEVAGNGGILVNPFTPSQISEALLRLEADKNWYQEQVAYGLERVKQFSWNQTTDKYIEIYNSIKYSCPYD